MRSVVSFLFAFSWLRLLAWAVVCGIGFALTACVSGITEEGLLFKVGAAAGDAHRAIINTTGAEGTTSWLTIVGEVAKYLGLSGAGLTVLHGAVSLLPWSKGEKKDIGAIAVEAVKADAAPKV